MEPQIVVTIEHASFDPWRRANVTSMLKEINRAPVRPTVFIAKDVDRNIWHTYQKAAMSGLRDKSVTHLVMLQDDILLCRDFVPGVEKIIRAKPCEVISLFYVSREAERAREQDARWILIPGAWGQAVIWPREIMEGMLEWSAHEIRPEWTGEDRRAGLYVLKNKIPVWATAPSLVQHLRSVDSLLGNRTPQPRIARWFVGEGSPLDFDWGKEDFVMAPKVGFMAYVKKYKLENVFINQPQGGGDGSEK